jgi:hypothetical protein
MRHGRRLASSVRWYSMSTGATEGPQPCGHVRTRVHLSRKKKTCVDWDRLRPPKVGGARSLQSAALHR